MPGIAGENGPEGDPLGAKAWKGMGRMLACPMGLGHWIKIVTGLREHELTLGPEFWFGLFPHPSVTLGGSQPFLSHSSLCYVLGDAGAPETG